MKKITIAIDGYSSSGKSTMARDLARRIGYTYIDSGAMYRAVTLYAMRHGMIDPQGKVDTAALTAALPDIHISFAPASTTDGVQHTQLNGEDVERDIRGMEVFVNASAEERARRRQKELEEKTGKPVDYAEILSNIRERDRIDSTREVSPLRQAEDAVLLDNDDMNHQQQMQWLMDLYHSIVKD